MQPARHGTHELETQMDGDSEGESEFANEFESEIESDFRDTVSAAFCVLLAIDQR